MAMLSMNEVTTYRWSLDEDVEQYVAAGYEGIGVWRRKLADYGEERAVDLIAESGLQVSNLAWAGGFTGSDGRSLAESVEDARYALRLAGALGAGCLILYAGGRNNHIAAHAQRLLHMGIEHLLDDAADFEVTIALEPMHPACAAHWTFLTNMQSTLDVIERFRSPFLKLALDAYHFGDDPLVLDDLHRLVPHIGIVHLGDRFQPHSVDQDRCPLGAGLLPLTDLVRRLLGAGYVGDFDVKLLGRDIEQCCYDKLLSESLVFFEELTVGRQ